MTDLLLTHLSLPQVYMFEIPPLQSNTGYNCAEWSKQHIWSGALKIISDTHDTIYIHFIDHTTQELFLGVQAYNSNTVQPCNDSSRYFVIRVQQQKIVRMLGIGFSSREHSFDFKKTLQDVLNGQRSVVNESSTNNIVSNTTDTDDIINTEQQSTADLTLKQPIHISLPNIKLATDKSNNSTTGSQSVTNAVAAIGLSVPNTSKRRITHHTDDTTPINNTHVRSDKNILNIDSVDRTNKSNSNTQDDDPFAELQSSTTQSQTPNTVPQHPKAANADDWVAF